MTAAGPLTGGVTDPPVAASATAPIPSSDRAEAADRAIRRAYQLSPWSLGVSLGALLIAALLGSIIGPAELGAFEVVKDLIDRLPLISIDSGLDARQQTILTSWRLPRVALGALVGSSLAMSGAAYQGVFRNPLASPWLLGAAAGAGLGATIVIAFGLDVGWGPVNSIPAGAFVGALTGVSISMSLGRLTGRSTTGLLLAGVATAAFLTAIQTYLQQRNADTLRAVYAWIFGRISTSGWSEVGLLLPYVVICGAILFMHRRHLDVLRVGEDEASSLGLDPKRVRLVVVVTATLMTAAAVSVSGLISFVGIIVPHAVRLLFGTSYRILIPLSGICGATFIVLVDIAARTIDAPAELPIGVVTAFFGAPFFALALWNASR